MKCDNCKNKDICKHVEYMQSVEDKVKDLGLNKDISIRVDIKCGYMQENERGSIIKFLPLEDTIRTRKDLPSWVNTRILR